MSAAADACAVAIKEPPGRGLLHRHDWTGVSTTSVRYDYQTCGCGARRIMDAQPDSPPGFEIPDQEWVTGKHDAPVISDRLQGRQRPREYTPSGMCLGCVFGALTCHAPRQRVMDQQRGSFTACNFYVDIVAKALAASGADPRSEW